MIGLAQARQLAGARLSAKLSAWATESDATEGRADPLLSIPLKPPSEREVLADQLAAESWVREWQSATRPDGTEIDWQVRSWRSIGRQQIPVRLRLHDGDAVAAFAGGAAARQWHTLTERRRRLQAALGGSAALDAAIRRHAAEIIGWDAGRFDQVVAAATWLARTSVEGMRPRQLPIRGVDSKWFGSHRAVLAALHSAATGRADLGIVTADHLVRVRFLDPHLAPGGMTDLAVPATELARLDVAPAVVFVFENLESVLAMPPWTGAIVVHGSGYAVDVVGDLPWVRRSPVVYWGDLDSNGFAIAHRLRTRLPHVISALMDEQTLLAHRDLWVSEPKPSRGSFDTLTADEGAALERLRAEGDVRLEQERIDWDTALEQLRQRATSVLSGDDEPGTG